MKAQLGMAFENLAGKDGNTVARRTKQGVSLIPYTIPHNPNTAAQKIIRNDFAKASQTFKGLTNTQVQTWKDYAAGVTFRDPVTGREYHPSDITAFMQLAVKFLQVNPTGTIPVAPPASPFAGNNITVSAGAGTGKVTFTSSGANAANVKTEVLLQRLKGAHWTPTEDGYRSKGFNAFTAGQLFDVPVTAGWYAAAYRFVNTLTGQATELVPINVSQVTLSLSGHGPATKRKAA